MTPPASSYPRLASDPLAAGLAQVVPWAYIRVTREGEITYANGHFGRMLNRYTSEIRGCMATDFFTSEAGEPPISHLLATLDGEKAWHGSWIARVGQHPFSFEIMLRVDPADSETIWGIVLENPVINDQMVVSNRNELRLLQTLLDNTLDFLYLLDTTGHFIITNRAFQKAIHVPYPGYEIGKRLGDFVCEETRRQFAVTDRRVLDAHKPLVNHVSFFRLKDGEGLWVQTTKMPVFDIHRNCIGLACVSRDISELKENTKRMRQAMRRAEIASAAKSDFLANMSHEIRTPINGIVGMTELCLDTNLDEEQRDYLDSVMSCTHTLLKVVNDILDFSKMEGGHLRLEHIDFDLHSCLHDIISHLGPSARDKGLDLRVEIDERTPRRLNGDPTRLRQILYNLLNNAIKFTDTGYVELRAEPTTSDYPDPNIRLYVSDTGIGIPEDRQETIFQSFTQADTSTTRKFGGTGLGLAICRRIVDLMGGAIDVDSDLGEGSCFIVELALGPAGNENTDEVSSEREMEPLPPMKILVVEDNPVNQKVILRRLNKMGHHVILSDSGTKALKLIQEHEFDLVFSDLHMPGMDGIELIERVRAREAEEELPRLPFIAMTARAQHDDRDDCRQAGMDGYITKPYRTSTIYRILRRVAMGESAKGSFTHSEQAKIFSFSRMMSQLDEQDREDMLEAAGVYQENYQQELEMLSGALSDEDLHHFEQLVHRVRGGLGALGDREGENIAEELEELAQRGEKAKLESSLQALAARMEALAREIECWLDGSHDK